MVVVCVIAKQPTRIVAIADAFEAYDEGIIETTIDECQSQTWQSTTTRAPDVCSW